MTDGAMEEGQVPRRPFSRQPFFSNWLFFSPKDGAAELNCKIKKMEDGEEDSEGGKCVFMVGVEVRECVLGGVN